MHHQTSYDQSLQLALITFFSIFNGILPLNIEKMLLVRKAFCIFVVLKRFIIQKKEDSQWRKLLWFFKAKYH